METEVVVQGPDAVRDATSALVNAKLGLLMLEREVHRAEVDLGRLKGRRADHADAVRAAEVRLRNAIQSVVDRRACDEQSRPTVRDV